MSTDDTSRPLRLLLVEDHADLAAVTAVFLKNEGYEVQAALSGREALQAALSFAPQLILCDVNLPDMSGFEVVHALRSNAPTQRMCFALITAMWGTEDTFRNEAAHLGIDAVLCKPITAEAVRRLVTEFASRGDRVQTVPIVSPRTSNA